MRAVARDALLFLALALVATWPLALHFGSSAPGLASWAGQPLFPETTVNLWNLWWFRHAIVDLGRSPFHCPLLFHPHGANLWFHTLAPLHGLVALPLQPLLGLAAAQNVLIILNLVASAVAASALARAFGVSPAGARVSGAVFAFAPVAFAHLAVGHFELLSTFWFPLELLLFLRMCTTSRWTTALALGLLVGASPWSSPYAFVFGVELLLVAAAFRWRALLGPRVAGALVLAAAVAAVCVAPMAIRFVAEAPATAPANRDFAWLSLDPGHFLVPSFVHPWLGPLLQGVQSRLQPGRLALPQEHTAYLGFAVVALAGLALRRPAAARPDRLLLAIGVVFGVLALGSELRLFGHATGLPLPAGLLDSVPILRLARAPGRYAWLVMLAAGTLAGAGFDTLRSWRWRAVAVAAIAFEFAALPVPLLSARPAPVYARLAAAPGDFAVLELPLQVRDGQHLLGGVNAYQALGQTVHGHPILGGMVSRLPPETWQAAVSAPLVGTLLNPVGVSRAALERDRREAPAWFARHGVRAIVVHAEEAGGPRQRYVESVLPIASREGFADGSVLLWTR